MPQIIRKLFEEEFARRIGCREATAVNSGTSALVGALMSLELNGGEVITTPFTFPSTVNAIVLAGGKPVFVDINEDCLINTNMIEKAITRNTKAILPVHLFGRVCNMERIVILAAKWNVKVVEDASQALGAKDSFCNDCYAGNFGHIGCFSFYKTKSLSCFEGGMIIGGDQHKIKCYTDPIVNCHAGWPVIGHNFRMPEPCCLIGYERLKLHWDEIVAGLGKQTEKDGYYPDVIYNLPCYKTGRYALLNGIFPVAESMAAKCRNMF